MKLKNIFITILLLPVIVLASSVALASSGSGIRLKTAYTDMNDSASLKRGAKHFMNYCASCHSLKYIRYEQIAEAIGFVDDDGKIDENLVYQDLIFTDAKVTDPVLSSMPDEQALQSFGVLPPDLTLVSRVRGNNWLYTYFQSFYKDDNRPLGTNNLLFPDVAMPNVFESLQGAQVPLFKREVIHTEEGDKEVEQIVALELAGAGAMTTAQFQQMATDLVNFLDYVGEPKKLDRYRTGVWVLLFLAFLLIAAYLLKKEYWKDVH